MYLEVGDELLWRYVYNMCSQTVVQHWRVSTVGQFVNARTNDAGNGDAIFKQQAAEDEPIIPEETGLVNLARDNAESDRRGGQDEGEAGRGDDHMS